jgi:hypothetical protein
MKLYLIDLAALLGAIATALISVCILDLLLN